MVRDHERALAVYPFAPMAGRTVTTPGGDTWNVRRLWAPRLGGEAPWARLRKRARVGRRFMRGVGEASDAGCAADALEDLFFLSVIVAVLVILALIGLPLVLAVVDLAVLIVLTVLGIVVRIVFRRPWVVEARSITPVPVDASDGEGGPTAAPPRQSIAVTRGAWWAGGRAARWWIQWPTPSPTGTRSPRGATCRMPRHRCDAAASRPTDRLPRPR